MFTSDEIKAAVAKDLNTDITIPSGHKGAVVLFVDTTGARIALATKVKDNWDVELKGEHDWTGNNDVGVVSKITW